MMRASFLTARTLVWTALAVFSQSLNASVELNPAPLSNQGRLVEFANFFNQNLTGKVFVLATRDTPYQDKIIDYEYDISYFGLQLDPAGGLTFKSTYNIKRYIYAVDKNGKKAGEPVIKQNNQTSQCALRQMTRTTQELIGHCQKIADNTPNASILGYVRQLRITELNAARLVWKDSAVGYLEGFLLDKVGYSPQFEIQTISFDVKVQGPQTAVVLRKQISTYEYDLEKEQKGALLDDRFSESTATKL